MNKSCKSDSFCTVNVLLYGCTQTEMSVTIHMPIYIMRQSSLCFIYKRETLRIIGSAFYAYGVGVIRYAVFIEQIDCAFQEWKSIFPTMYVQVGKMAYSFCGFFCKSDVCVIHSQMDRILPLLPLLPLNCVNCFLVYLLREEICLRNIYATVCWLLFGSSPELRNLHLL